MHIPNTNGSTNVQGTIQYTVVWRKMHLMKVLLKSTHYCLVGSGSWLEQMFEEKKLGSEKIESCDCDLTEKFVQINSLYFLFG